MTRPAARDRHLVIEASAMVALLADGGSAGEWVTANVVGAALSAPELMPYEVCNVLRRRAMNGGLDTSVATLAHEDLLALAEWLEVPLITLDARIARASGPACRVMALDGG